MNTVSRMLLGGATAIALSRVARAEDEDALDAEFLDYLGTCEGEQEDWTWFTEPEPEDDEPAGEDEDESSTEDSEQ